MQYQKRKLFNVNTKIYKNRAPSERLLEFLPREKVDNYDPFNFRLLVLADFLAEYGDPRELVVRRDMELRKGSFGENFSKLSKTLKSRYHKKYYRDYELNEESGFVSINEGYSNDIGICWLIKHHEFFIPATQEETEYFIKQFEEQI